VALLRQLLELIQDNPHLTVSALLEHWREREEGRYLMKLAQWRYPPNADLAAEFQGAMQRIYARRGERRLEQLMKKHFDDLTAEEKDELRQLLT
jgi:DNA primase